MSKLVVTNHVTLDGVMQSPGRRDEDTRDGFDRGGWAIPDNDAVMGRVMGEAMSRPAALLLGRRTYEDFASFWPKQTDNPFTEVLENVEKYVASTTLTEPLPWKNSTVLDGNAADAVAGLKARLSDNIVVLGSGDLIQSLRRRDLIDEYVLMIHPVVLGSGRRLFPDDTASGELELVDSVTTTTGVIIATYRPARATTGTEVEKDVS